MACPRRSRFFGAIREEARAVHRTWWPDWLGCAAARRDRCVVLNAAIYAFCFSFLTNAALGSALEEETRGELGVGDAFVSSAVTGLFMVVFGGQPMVLYGQTGPVVLLYTYVYSIAKTCGIPFGPWVAWIGLFAFVMHALLAVFGTCDFKKYVTPFTEELFAALVAADFITTAIIGFMAGFGTMTLKCDDPSHCVINGLSTLILGLWFYSLALKLGGLQKNARWSSGLLLRIMSEYYVPLALLITTLISYVPQWIELNGWPSAGVPTRIKAPSTWGLSTAHDYLMFARMGEVPGWAIAAALVPAFLLTVLFYVDQNLSAMMAVSGGGLCKCSTPEAFNLEFFLLGLTVLFTGLLGLPASSGLIPQNPMHTRALTVVSQPVAFEEAREADVEDATEDVPQAPFSRQTSETSTLAIVGPLPSLDSKSRMHVVEQRFSGFLHSALLGLIVFVLPILSWIPMGVLWGGFLLLASEAYSLKLVQRLLLCLTSPSLREEARQHYPDLLHVLDAVPHRTMFNFTLVQICLWLLLYIVAVLLKDVFPVERGNAWVMVGASFPVLVCLYAIPVRTHLLPKFFSSVYLHALDPLENEEQEDQCQNQMVVHDGENPKGDTKSCNDSLAL